MKKLLIGLFICMTPFFLLAQEDESESYMMWETFYFTPEYEDLEEMGKAMSHHNKTYHSDAPFTAAVFNVVTGPNTGKSIWIMGPCTYTDLDNRPSGEHDTDWRDNVMPYIDEMEQGEYWRMNSEMSTFAPSADRGPYNLLYVRYHEIKDGEGYRLNDLFEKISKTMKSMEDAPPWGMFYNEFWQGDIGRHIATVSYMDKWAELDRDVNFRKAFEAVHGENEWTNFLEEFNSVIDNSWDEIWQYMPQLSAGEE